MSAPGRAASREGGSGAHDLVLERAVERRELAELQPLVLVARLVLRLQQVLDHDRRRVDVLLHKCATLSGDTKSRSVCA
jgi:hypothetical protein